MNNSNDSLFRAIEARGAGRSLSADFIHATMQRVARAERARRRRTRAWTIAGSATAAALCAGSAAIFCGNIFARTAANVGRSLTSAFTAADPGTAMLMAALCPAVALLLAADHILRAKTDKKATKTPD